MARYRVPTYTSDFKPDKAAFRRLSELEPRLLDLEREALEVEWGPGYSTSRIWYGVGGLKERLSALVGYGTDDPKLKTSEVYDIVYEYLYSLIPDEYPDEPNFQDEPPASK